MAINFPNSPSVNDIHTSGDMSWKWNGTSWEATIITSIPIPSQSGQAGEFLTTDGTTMTWEPVVTNPYDTATTSTGYFDVPSGTTAQRPGSPATGNLRLNTTDTSLEHYADGTWIQFAGSSPAISSIGPTTAAVTGTSITMVGTNFVSGAVVKLIGTNAVQITAASTTVNSPTEIVFTTPVLLVANEPYDVKVTNPNGGYAVLDDALDAGGTPIWTTASGTIATIPDTATGTHVTLVATDPDSQAVTFAETTSVLTTIGVSLNSTTGAIAGDPGSVGAQTTYNFQVDASDGVNTTNRAFAIIVNVGNDGTTAARAAVTAQDLLDVSAASGTHWVWVHGVAYQMTYDSTDKFSNGVSGWIKYDDVFVGANNATLSPSFTQVGASVDSGWSGAASGGLFYLGDDGDSQTGATHMGRFQVKMPRCRYGAMWTLSASGSGNQTPDDTESWLTNPTLNNALNSYMALTVPSIPNTGGYPFAIWNGQSNATTGNSGAILPNEGGVLGSVSGAVTKTWSAGDFTNIGDFTAIVGYDPYFVAWTGDSGNEQYSYTDYEMWIH